MEQLYEKFGEPCTEPVVRTDGKPLSSGVPSQGISPVRLGKKANEIPLSEAHLIVSDFGEAFSPFDSQQKRSGDECRAPLPVLPPETHFDPEKPLSFPADIWTLACAIWSILGPRPLFDGTLATHDDISSQQIDILGPLPPEWWDKWEVRHEYFEETGQPKNGRFVVPSLDNCFEQEIQALRRRDGMGDFDSEETTALLAMLRPMLTFRPEERCTAATVLHSDWMVNWGLPELEKVPRV